MQTAYANGSSTTYITNQLGVPVAFTPTGVKHLHHRAVQFPIGVYFEANGHGTVVFDEKTQALIRSKGGAKLNALMDVINQTVGDAISDMLLVECVLADRDWDCEQWFNCYKDLPNRLGKVAVRDRAMVTTTDAERKVVTPEKLQPGIDAIVAKFSQGRSFVRPRCAKKSKGELFSLQFLFCSGTEDCVRVYSEASTREEADALNMEVSNLVVQLCG